jgi:hypothetical protein
MPRDDVDHAALAIDRIRHLGRQDPGRKLPREPAGDKVVELRVLGIEESIEVAGTPTRDEVDRTSSDPATRRMVSSENVPGWPRSSREIVARDTPDRRARSDWVHRRLTRTARIAVPNRWSSMGTSLADGP